MSRIGGNPGGKSGGNTSANSSRRAENSGRVSLGPNDIDGVIVRTNTMPSSLIADSNGFLCNSKRGEGVDDGGGGNGEDGSDGLSVKFLLLCLKV